MLSVQTWIPPSLTNILLLFECLCQSWIQRHFMCTTACLVHFYLYCTIVLAILVNSPYIVFNTEENSAYIFI